MVRLKAGDSGGRMECSVVGQGTPLSTKRSSAVRMGPANLLPSGYLVIDF